MARQFFTGAKGNVGTPTVYRSGDIATASPADEVLPHPLAALASPMLYFVQSGWRMSANAFCRSRPGQLRRDMRLRGDDPMRWLTAILALLLLGLVAFPTVESVRAWLAPRSDSVQSINYLSREIHELSASRRATRRHDQEVAPAD
jgi:hypothetical protein